MRPIEDKFEHMCHKLNKNHALLDLPFVSELYKYPVSEERKKGHLSQCINSVILAF